MRDLVLAELLSTYTSSLGYALSMLDREHQTGSVKTWSRAGIRCQRVGEVESKSADDTTNGETGQATVPRAGRAPAVGRRRMYQTPSGYPDRQQSNKGIVPRPRGALQRDGRNRLYSPLAHVAAQSAASTANPCIPYDVSSQMRMLPKGAALSNDNVTGMPSPFWLVVGVDRVS